MSQRPKKKQRQKRSRNIMALLFIGVTALICLVNFIAKDKESSEKENRMLTQKPAVTWAGIESGRFMSQ